MGLTERKFPEFGPGDAVRVAQRVKEGDKERTQYFEGDVIAIHHNGIASTFTVRRIAANGIAVERIFPFHSPNVEGIEFLRKGDVRRAKLYYMRGRIGKSARVKERVFTHEEKMSGEEAPAAESAPTDSVSGS
ncbi:MAG: 50S ribosomal protein L19 [Candidatus Dependentiae bacterium]|nr:50S ribosomal protein L19 [Candidatus Dependentiae bacterium]